MKFVYEAPKGEIVYLWSVDVIATSGLSTDPGENDGEWIEA